MTRILSGLDFATSLSKFKFIILRLDCAVKAWLNLRDKSHWLMIYDNYDNPRTANHFDRSTVDLRRYLPESDQGSVIITTRSANVTHGQRLHIQKLTGLEDGLKILSNMSRRENIEDGTFPMH
jgi:hypothetical protein